MFYKEYSMEDNKSVDLDKLKADLMSEVDYTKAHSNLPIMCADILIKFQGGFLLIKRKNYPARNEIWSIGGRLLRGFSTTDSIKKIAKRECGLDIDNINLIGLTRQFYQTDPFGHGKGTDTPAFMVVADGKGEIKLDDAHNSPIIVTKESYISEFRKSLHPYIKDFLEVAFETP